MRLFRVSGISVLPAVIFMTGMAAGAAAPSGNSIEFLRAFVSAPPAEPTPPLPAQAGDINPELSGERLFQYLHTLLNSQGSAVVEYLQAKAYMFSKADNATCNGGPGIITFYSRVCAGGSSSSGNDYREQGDQNGDGVVDKIVNTEHIWPQCYFNRGLPMRSDLHQLAPTFETPNSRRSNLKFARVSKAVYSTSSGSKLGAEGFEPADAVKGNAARAMLYFVVRYYDRDIRRGMDYNDFWTSRVPMLLEWNRLDPPDADELRRNGLVEVFQGNRNPFIDDPTLAEKIGAAVFMSH